jgi:SAM-dependent methyltransferase
MEERKQVSKAHYEFDSYMTKERWISLWHQLEEVRRLDPRRVLEIGPGPGLFKAVATLLGLHVETLDLDPELKPDHLGSATSLPFPDASFDVVCAFQMLEHLPYGVSLKAFEEMSRVSSRHVVISLPDAQPAWRYSLYVPKLGSFDVLFPRPSLRMPEHRFNGEHHWEIGKRGYELSRITTDLSARMPMLHSFRVLENPYHRFFVFGGRGPRAPCTDPASSAAIQPILA